MGRRRRRTGESAAENGAAAASSYGGPDRSVDGLGGDQSRADVLANALRHAVGGEGSESDQGQGPALATGPGTVSTAGFASAFLAE
jgi:hypothetical protein